MEMTNKFSDVFSGKKVLVTGHTGFKGSWLSLWLHLLGAKVIGYALPPTGDYDNYSLVNLQSKIIDIRGDIRDKEHLREVFETHQPDFVFHLAAQAIVRDSYLYPVDTVETNVMGTVNILENIRLSESVKAGLIVTSDKCYENKEQIWGYREEDMLGGHDPYSASKGCAELITASYRRSFFSCEKDGIQKPVSTARAGNVIGGGDWSVYRILPDCVRSLEKGEPIGIRNPNAVRPWQFVLEPLYGYLLLVSGMLGEPKRFCGAWNFGPDFKSVVSVREVVEKVLQHWGTGEWVDRSDGTAPHEAGLLNLDCSKAKARLHWRPRLSLDEVLEWTLAWYQAYQTADMYEFCCRQIEEYSMRCFSS